MSSPSLRRRALAGTPTRIESSAASFVTTAFAPTAEPAPIVIGCDAPISATEITREYRLPFFPPGADQPVIFEGRAPEEPPPYTVPKKYEITYPAGGVGGVKVPFAVNTAS